MLLDSPHFGENVSQNLHSIFNQSLTNELCDSTGYHIHLIFKHLQTYSVSRMRFPSILFVNHSKLKTSRKIIRIYDARKAWARHAREEEQRGSRRRTSRDWRGRRRAAKGKKEKVSSPLVVGRRRDCFARASWKA